MVFQVEDDLGVEVERVVLRVVQSGFGVVG